MGTKFKVFPIFILIVLCAEYGNCARILGMFTTPSKSHLIIHMSVVRGLVEKGHDVTVVTTLPLSDKNPKYRHIQVNAPGIPRTHMKEITTQKTSGPTNLLRMFHVMDIMMENANAALQDQPMQRLMKEESFDLVIHGLFVNEFEIGLAAHFKCPIVVIWMNQPVQIINNMVGNPTEMSYVPALFSGIKQPMNMWQRIINVCFTVIETCSTYYMRMKMNKLYELNFPSDKYPSFDESLKNISLVLVCNHFTQGPIRPYVPAMIEIGGIQIKSKPDPLPSDIQAHLDSCSDHGAIYFSLGTNVQSSDLRPETIHTMYKVLSKLKQKVIWKWETDDVPGNAENILFKKWLPQNDILAHPNIKLFISHGGLGSVVEARDHAVPLIGLPIYGDQQTNMRSAELEGWGLTINIHELKEQQFRETILEVIENPKYKNKVQRLSNLFNDRPATPLETAVFWIEYVIRHKGAPHMQSPAVHMSFIEYHSLDVIGFLILVLYIVCKVLKLIGKFIFRKCCRRNEPNGKNKKD